VLTSIVHAAKGVKVTISDQAIESHQQIFRAKMNAIDADDAIVGRLFRDGKTADAVQKAIQACRHLGPEEQEPPALRDARADLLTKIIMVQVHEGCEGEVATREETALLERRVLNWLFHGKNVEAELFPAATTSFDQGIDRVESMTLMQYISKHVEEGTASGEHVAWLYETDAALSAEIWRRFTGMKPNTLRVGSRVYGVGLTKAVELNGQKGTITRRVHGKRWGIIFDRDNTSKALLPANLRAEPEIPQPSPRSHMAAEQAMLLLRHATDWIETQPTSQLRHDIPYRIRLARRVLEGDTRPVKCGEPLEIEPGYEADEYDMMLLKMKMTMKCHGNGIVDFLEFGKVLMGERKRGDMVFPFREWLLSGLCAACQEEIMV